MPRMIDDDARAATFARLMNADHMDAHGGAFRIGKAVGVFLNFGNLPPLWSNLLKDLDRHGFTVIGKGATGPAVEPEDSDYSWAALIDIAPTSEDLEALRVVVRDAVREFRDPNYADFQFKIVV